MKITKELSRLPIERAIGVISGRWKARIIHVLLDGSRRTCDLEYQIAGITQKVLIEQLRVLEEQGLVYRQSHAHEPQRVDYGLTPLGLSLKPLLSALDDWGHHHAEELKETDGILSCEAVIRRPPGKKKIRVKNSESARKAS